jgi:phosphatidylinositol alpha-1,6-mannosyltransferase
MIWHRKQFTDISRSAARVLLLMPEISARRGGGIQQVGSSLMRLLDARRRDGLIDCRVLSLGQLDDNDRGRDCKRDWRERLACYGDRRFAFSRAALASMAFWADAAIITHVGLASLLSLLPRPIRPVSMTFIHGIEVWRPLRLRHRLALVASDYILADSQFTAQKAAQHNPWMAGVRCCHLGIPLATAAVADPRGVVLQFSPSTHDVLIVGRMAKGEGCKGHRELIGAMQDLVAAVPDARLLIAGTGDDVQTYLDLARRSPVCEKIVFLGYVEDEILRLLYQRVGVFAMPSRQEGFGLVYLEAMAAGLPCLASTCDAAGEIVLDGETGLLVDPSNQAAIVGALARLLRDQGFRKKSGCQGRKRFQECFTEERFHQRLWDLVDEALASRGRGAARIEGNT